MAAKNKQQEGASQEGRLIPTSLHNSSRVSSAAGGVGSQRSLRGRGGQQDADVPSVSRRRASGPPAGKPPTRSRSAKGQSNARAKSPTRSSRYGANMPPEDDTRDARVINWLINQWKNLEAHQRQNVYSVLLLFLSLILLGSLTIFRHAFILKGINNLFILLFGWSAYIWALGLVVFAVAHLLESVQRRSIISWRLVIGLCSIILLVLFESHLLFPTLNVGSIAGFITGFLIGWGALIGHIILLGLLIAAIVITFQITFGHVMLLIHAIQRTIPQRTVLEQDDELEAEPSPFQGQRPRFSRYSGFQASDYSDETVKDVPTPSPRGRRQGPAGQRGTPTPAQDSSRGRRPQVAESENDDESIEFEPDFNIEDDDPRNDINLHKQEVGLVPRGPRDPAPRNAVEYQRAVQGVSQQQLPFHAANAEQPPVSRRASRRADALDEMEPLQPNPRNRAKGARGVAEVDGTNGGQDAQAPSLWKIPDTALLHNPEDVKLQMLGEDTASLARLIQETLRSFRVDAEVRQEDISIGPTVIRFGIRPTGKPEMTQDEKGRPVPVRDASGNIVYETRTRVSRIMALQNDLALMLEAKSIRMEAPVPGRPYVGVEIPNKNSRLVTLREVLESKEYLAAKAKSKLAIGLGKDVAGQVRVGDLTRMPHLLIAGATGAGKSVCINTIIASFLTQATPEDVRLLMVDPKMVELSMYNGIPHLLSPVVTEVEKVVPLLKNAITEMERRYRLFSQLGVRNLDGYRKMRAEKQAKGDGSLANMPAIVIIIDELADLMMAAPEEVEGMICRLAQLARATGIHLVVATQRPSVDVITGLIKANIPTRISFMVSSAVDSRTIIDMGGAERLLGRGDMLYLPADAGRPERIQGAFLADDEAEALVQYWRQQFAQQAAQAIGTGNPAQQGQPQSAVPALVEPGWEIKEEAEEGFELEDDLLDEAEEVVREYGKASISLLQRRLRVGYSRAARLIDLLEERGVIGHVEQGGRSREVFEQGNNGNNGRYGRNGGDEGHSLADEVAAIASEEKARDEFLRKQAEMRKPGRPPQDDEEV